MKLHRTKKKSPVCTKNPVGVGHPVSGEAIDTTDPTNF